MSALERYQRELIEYLYAPQVGAPPPSLAEAERTSPERLALGLTIYRRNLILGLCRAMAGTYPLCRDLLGKKNFDFLCKQYLHRFPSRVWDLGKYGECFADFLSERPEVADHPFLADVARLEWLCDRATRLPREAWLEPGDFGRRPDADRLACSTLPLRTEWTILELWKDHRQGGIEAIRPQTIRSRPQHLLVWSEAGSPQVCEVAIELWPALSAERS